MKKSSLATTAKKPLESAVQRSILQAISLKYPRALLWRNQSTGTFDPRKKIFRKQNSPYSAVGSSDIFLLIDGVFISLEVKRGPSAKPTNAQKEWIDSVIRCQGHGGVVWDVAGALSIIEYALRAG